jgi:transcriptional regulator GlxA family with amidase domain
LLRSWHGDGVRIAAACTATFLLGQCGLLDGKEATTTWWLTAAFRTRFPAVKLTEHRIVVDSGSITTAGAALSHLDVALAVVQQVSPALARTTARHLTFDRRELQSAYVLADHIAHGDSFVQRFEQWTKKHLDSFSLAKAARAMGVSERTLERRTRDAIGKSPLALMQDLRVDEAIFLLESTDRGLDEIAERVGYTNGVTLRTLLRRRTGMSIRQIRSRR